MRSLSKKIVSYFSCSELAGLIMHMLFLMLLLSLESIDSNLAGLWFSMTLLFYVQVVEFQIHLF